MSPWIAAFMVLSLIVSTLSPKISPIGSRNVGERGVRGERGERGEQGLIRAPGDLFGGLGLLAEVSTNRLNIMEKSPWMNENDKKR